MTGFLLGVDEENGHRHLKAGALAFCTLLVLLGGLGVALWLDADPLANASDIRVRNETGVPLGAVRINGVSYGDIGVGATTPYLKHKLADEYAMYKLTIDGALMQSNPQLIGKSLGPGRFTYVITASEPFDSHGRKIRSVWVRLEHGRHDLDDPAA